MARPGSALIKAKRDVENAADARKPGDAAEDAADGAPMNALMAALKKKQPRKGQMSGPISGLGQRVTGPSTSTTRVGY